MKFSLCQLVSGSQILSDKNQRQASLPPVIGLLQAECVGLGVECVTLEYVCIINGHVCPMLLCLLHVQY